jgi:hypothetical protein
MAEDLHQGIGMGGDAALEFHEGSGILIVEHGGGQLPGEGDRGGIIDPEAPTMLFHGDVTLQGGAPKIISSTLLDILQESDDDLAQGAILLPEKVMAIAGLPGGILARDALPGCPGGKFMKDAFEDGALVEGGTPAPTGGGRRGEEGLNEEPLLRGEGHYLKIFRPKQRGTIILPEGGFLGVFRRVSFIICSILRGWVSFAYVLGRIENFV